MICIYPTPQLHAGYDTRSISKWSKAGLNSSRPVAIAKLKSQIYHIINSIAGVGKDRVRPFQMTLVQSEMQRTSSRI